jgi:hypothetical protein
MRQYEKWNDAYVLETEWDVMQANEVRTCGFSWKIGDVVQFPKEWINKYSY